MYAVSKARTHKGLQVHPLVTLHKSVAGKSVDGGPAVGQFCQAPARAKHAAIKEGSV